MRKILFAAADAPATGGTPTDENKPPVEAEKPVPPPAAVTVIDGTITEENQKLRAELDAAKGAQKKAETLAAAKEDELHRLKQVAKPAKPAKMIIPRRVLGMRRTEDAD